MSLVPYSSRDSREIVLRHDDAIVIRDPQSKQLILRGATSASQATDCPYCHQPLQARPPEREARATTREESFVSPEYFRMLHLASDTSDDEHNPPSSPIRRLVQPAFSSPVRASGSESGVSEAEFVTSAPAATDTAEGQGIKREAFSPNYFKKFFTEEKELGRGGKGVVLLVRHELDGVFLGNFACKRVPVGDDHAWLEKVLIEVQLLQRLSHPNLVSYRHVWLEDVKLNRFGPSVPCAFILQQYCNAGDLLHYVVGDSPITSSTKEQLKAQMRRRSKGHAERPNDLKHRRLSFEEIYSFFKDITSGLAHLHASNYIHRDLKPSNCLLNKTGNDLKCLISDFGEVQAENIVRKSTGATGTISYCAPEVLKKDASGRFGNFSTKSDIFSLGMILYFLCFARLPYSSADNIQEEFEDLDQLRAEISTWSGFQDERKERPDLPDQLYEFLKRLLALNPHERPSAEDILQAIRTGSGLESPTRAGRSNSRNGRLGVGKRIQPIDSPASGTPLLGGGRVLSPVQPEDAKENEESSPTQITSKELDDALIEHRRHSQSPQTPLLMPPPSIPVPRFRSQLDFYRRRTIAWVILNHRLVILATKVAFFAIKMYSISKPCVPLATNSIFAYPLMMLAALDLVMGIGVDWRASVLLLVVHFAVLAIAMSSGGLCAGRGQRWKWEVD